MKQENRTKQQLVPEELAQEVYARLSKRTKRSFEDYKNHSRPLRMTLPAKSALFLDDIFEIAEKHKGQAKDDTLAQIVDLGIVAWCANLDTALRDSLGLSSLGAPDKQISNLDDDEDQSQPATLLYEESLSGYTPMTSHGFGNGTYKNGAMGSKTPPANGMTNDARRPKHHSRKRRTRGHS